MTHDQVKSLLQSVAKDTDLEGINLKIKQLPLSIVTNQLAIRCFLKARNNDTTRKFRKFYEQYMVKGVSIVEIEI